MGHLRGARRHAGAGGRARLNEAANKALASKGMTDNFAKTFAQPRPGTPADLEAFLRKEIAKWGKAVAVSGAQVD